MKRAFSEVQTLLRLSDARQDAILKASLDAIVIMDAAGCFVEFNPAAESLFGYTRDQVIGRPIADFIIPERLRDSHRKGMVRYLSTGVGAVVNQRLELPALTASGEEFPVELAIVPVDGQATPMFVGFIRDMTAQKQADQRRQWMLEELAHRGRNLFTVVQAVITRTMQGDRPARETGKVLSDRIAALARSHAALVAAPEGADLARIVAQELEGFSNRVTATGPTVLVNAKAAQAISLIIHELATNASKYGALSTSVGAVALTWNVRDDQFLFEWREQGGPQISAPGRSGFGSVVLEQLAAGELMAKVELSFVPSGFVYTLVTAVAAIR